ncbi:MAG: T9SS type A sorting domain-containing protein [Chitinophagales bacterium]
MLKNKLHIVLCALALLLGCCLNTAQAQYVKAGEYFWDTDPGYGSGYTFVAQDGNFNEALENAIRNNAVKPVVGYHLLNIRIKDNNDKWGPLFKKVVLVDDSAQIANNMRITAAEFFWDTDPGYGSATALLAFDGNFNEALEAAFKNNIALPDTGLHLLNIRVKDNRNKWGPLFKKPVFVGDMLNNPRLLSVRAAEYFWDTDPGYGSATALLAFDGNFNEALEQALTTNATLPAAGLHLFNIRVKGENNNWGPLYKKPVLVSDVLTTMRALTVKAAEYFWDTDPGYGSATALLAFDGNFNEALEQAFTNNLAMPSTGIHLFNVRVKAENNKWGPLYKKPVNVSNLLNSPRALTVKAGEFFWDTDPGYGLATPVLAFDGNFNEALEVVSKTVNSFTEGLHLFNIRVKDERNNWGPLFKKAVQVDAQPRQFIITQGEYFWDTDPGYGAGYQLVAFDGNYNEAMEVGVDFNATTIVDGIHLFNTRFKDEKGRWGPLFKKVCQINGNYKSLDVKIDHNDTTICSNDSILLIASGAGSFVWSPSTGLNHTTGNAVIAKPTITTTYRVIGQGNPGVYDTAYITITVLPGASVNLGADQSVCAPQTVTLNAGTASTYSWSTGATSQTIVVSTTGNYSVTVSNVSGCTSRDTVHITVDTVPVVSIAPSTASICNGQSIVLTASGGVTYAWSNSSVGSAISVSPTSTTTYTVTATGSGVCSATASRTVTVNNLPTASVSPATQTICNGQSATLTASGGTSYVWSTTATTAAITVSPTANTTYTVTVTNAANCSATASGTVNVNSVPSAQVTPSTQTICNGQSATLTASGGTSYVWSTTATTAAITVSPTANTTYTVTVTNAANCTATASGVVNVNAVPTAQVTPATQSICNGQSATLTASGGTSYVWSTTATTAAITVSPTTNTTYTVTVTNASNCSATASGVVNVNALPTAQVTPSSQSICNGQNATLTASGGTNYVWNTSASTAAITVNPTSTTTYTVTVTNASNCTATASGAVTVNSLPTAQVTPSTQTICNGQSATLTASGGASYVWSTTATTAAITVSPTVNTTYTVTVTSAANCSATASGSVSVNAVPTAQVTPSTQTICNGQSATLTASGGASYVWNTTATTAAITVSPTANTTYTVTVTNAANCSATASGVVNVNALPAAQVSPASQTVCAGTQVTLTASGGTSYVWSTTATTAAISVTPSTTTTYTVTVTNANNCSATTSGVVNVNALPNAQVNPATVALCTGQSTTLTASGGTQYVWNTTATTAAITVSPTSNTVYTVTVTNAANCSATAQSSVTVNTSLVPVITPANPAVCLGSSVTLTASAGSSYNWSNSATTQSITVSPTTATTYTVTVTNGSGCSGTASTTVAVNSNPTAQVTPATQSICNGQSATLTASGGTSYSWSNSATTAAITVSPTVNTTYTVTVSNANNCSATASGQVTVNQNPTAAITPTTATICSGASVTLTASGGTGYTWSTSATTAAITVSPTTTTTYTVTVTNASNCSATASRLVTVNSLPTAAVNPSSTSICSGNSATLTASGGNTYAWSNGLGSNATVSVSPINTTTYTVTITDGNNCSATASSAVTVNQNPTASINPATVAICAGNSATLTASGGTQYNWSNSLGTNAQVTVSPANSTTYSVTVTDANNCSATASRLVTVNSNPTAAISPATVNICNGASATLTASGGTGYTWSTSATTAAITVSPSSTTTYTVTVTNAANCSATASRLVSVNPLPTASISPATVSICNGTSATLTASGGSTYNWSNSLGSNAQVTVSPTATTTYTVTVTDANSCSATANRQVTVKQPTASTLNNSICTGSTFFFNGQFLSQAGTYRDTLVNAVGCDSIITLNLSVNSFASSSFNVSICLGQSYVYNGQTLTQSGAYNDTLTAQSGCDSIVTLNLTVNNLTSSSFNHSICQGASYLFNGQQLTAAGNYNDTLVNSKGCDSIITLHLIVLSPSASAIAQSICQGSSFTFNGQSLTQSGTYRDTLVNAVGCDSIITLNLTVLSPTTVAISQSICAGSSYLFNGQNLTQSGTYHDTLVAANGCDSIVTLTLSVLNPSASTINQSICSGSSYSFGGQNLTQAGTYHDTLTNAAGCDSVITLNLTVNNVLNTAVADTICAGDVLQFGGLSLTSAGVYRDTLAAQSGCDSIITLTLVVNPVPVPTINRVADTLSTQTFVSYQWLLNNVPINGATNQSLVMTQNGNYSVVVTNTNGCSDTSTIVNAQGVDITEVIDAWGVKLYPNPNTGNFVIEFAGDGERFIQITNAAGQLIYETLTSVKQNNINMPQVAAGMYFVRVNQAGSSRTLKVTVLQ